MHRNPSMTRPWIWAAGIGLAIFLATQVLPVLVDQNKRQITVLSRADAKRAALEIANNRFGIQPHQVLTEITHQSDSVAAGYIAQQKQGKRYEEIWAQRHPLDVYRADLHFRDRPGTLTLLLHMESGALVGWHSTGWHSTGGQSGSQGNGDNRDADARQALSYAANWGEQADRWVWNGNPPDGHGRWTFRSEQEGIGQSRLLLHVVMPSGDRQAASSVQPWEGGSVAYEIQVPDDFIAYLEQQNRVSGLMNSYGFIIPHLLLLILAMVYAAACRDFTSPRRGMLLALLFLVMYAIFYMNLIPGLRAGLLEDGVNSDYSSTIRLLIANFVVLGIMALFTYLSAVAGDGLWKSMGRNLWPGWREPAFGAAVWTGMKRGYWLAFLLLGVQSFILIGLALGIGMFPTTDASISTSNMTVPWLLLLLAWCAGISEEVQSRLFGIGLFRRWLLAAAARITGRPPSNRIAAWLTMLAMFPPGLFWAFGHVGYAVYPVYSRLIELVIMALLFGWFMLKFGFLSVMFAHIIFNSVLMSVQLLFDGLPGDWLAGLIGPILPVVVAYLIVQAHRRWGPGAKAVAGDVPQYRL